MTSIAKHIIVDRDEHGAPRLQIDGFVFDFATCGIKVPAPSLDEIPTVTVTFLAEKVTMINDDGSALHVIDPRPDPNEPIDPRDGWTCSHPGCLGVHPTPRERCC